MTYGTFWESMAANACLAIAYSCYELFQRIVGSKCHYTREHGLEIHLADPDEDIDLEAINSIFANRGLTLRIRDKDTA